MTSADLIAPRGLTPSCWWTWTSWRVVHEAPCALLALWTHSAIFPGAALQPLAQLLLQLLELVDDLTLLQRTSLVALPLREPRLALLLASFESVSARSQSHRIRPHSGQLNSPCRR
ncbi:hypothetical protein BE17_02305 [Sorangium cellulosum]|uniref:Uncharacterized protein n=1 Tax=Sorangium cellulosum TaxID=56 RepID=A0A150S112_SORCE|nr:hypothetical protein BE17_02305 [Sorangium cellulosum]